MDPTFKEPKCANILILTTTTGVSCFLECMGSNFFFNHTKKESLNEWEDSLFTLLQSKVPVEWAKIQSLSKKCPCSMNENLVIE